MRKLWSVFLFCIMLLAFSACEKKEEPVIKGEPVDNTLFVKASPNNSVMGFCYYDGKEGYSDWISDIIKEKEILESMTEVAITKVDSWDFKVTYPMYGLWMGTDDGMGIQMLWTNGYLITREGDVYTFDYDWKALFKELKWSEDSRRVIDHVAEMPNVRYLALDGREWNSKMMKPVPEPVVPDGISMELNSWGHTTVKATLHNENEESWMYGRPFRLDVKLKGKWYEVPARTDENWMFTSEGILLTSDEDREESFNIGMFGYLPEGTYRLVLLEDWENGGPYVVHEVKDTAEEVWKYYPVCKAEEPVAPDGVSVKLDAWTDTSIKVTIRNESEEDFSYGVFCRIDVLLEGEWYTIPDSQIYTLQGIVAEPGMERQAEFSVDQYAYGHLPKGTYRFVLEGLSIEHTIG